MGSFKLILMPLIASLLIITSGCGGSSGEKETKSGGIEKVILKAVTAWSQGNTMNEGFIALQKKVADQSDGQLEIVFGGGPETIPAFELSEAVRNGVVDIAWTAHTYNVSQIPVLEGAKLSRITPWEERESGAFDFYNTLYQEKMNVYYLGKGTPNLTYNLYTNIKPQNIADFKGLSIRVTPAYQAFANALGAAPVTTDPSEVYTALERKMIVGYGWPSVGIADFGWAEATKYVIDPPFYQVDVIGLVNLDKWNSLAPETQKVLNDSMLEVEKEMNTYFGELVAKDRELIKEKGVEIVELSPEEAAKYIETAYQAGWESVNSKAPDLASQLQSLISK